MNIDPIESFMHAPIPNKVIFVGMLLMSVWSLYVMVERFFTYKKASTQTFDFVRLLGSHLQKNQVDEALNTSKKYDQSPVARVVGSGLTAYKKGMEAFNTTGPQDVGDFDVVDSVNRALERLKEREVSRLRKGLGSLATIASIAPFVGLLGTVIGIIGAFDLLKGGGSFDVIGPAIAEALIATAVGLFAAIPAAMAFNYFTGRVENMVVDMSDVSSEFIDFVLREGRS